MRKFIIERDLPGAGKLTDAELRAIALRTCSVVSDLETQYYWVETFVTDHKLYCVHIAPDAEAVVRHALQGGFPVDHIAEIRAIIDPADAG
jgi:hypothetical protein